MRRARLTSAVSKEPKTDRSRRSAAVSGEIAHVLALDEHDRPLARHRRHRRRRLRPCSESPQEQGLRLLRALLPDAHRDLRLGEIARRCPPADSPRNPDARRSRIFHSRLLTAPESALSASGAVIFHVGTVLLERDAAARALHLDAGDLVVRVRKRRPCRARRRPSSARLSTPRRAPASPRGVALALT